MNIPTLEGFYENLYNSRDFFSGTATIFCIVVCMLFTGTYIHIIQSFVTHWLSLPNLIGSLLKYNFCQLDFIYTKVKPKRII